MLNILDNTLRDGANLIGHGFNLDITKSVIEGLLSSGIKDIEIGNCAGVGAYELLDLKKAPSDGEYFEAIAPYVKKGRIGMFLVPDCAAKEVIEGAKNAGLRFLRVGSDAGTIPSAIKAVRAVKEAGLICRFAMSKCYYLGAKELAEEAKMLEANGVDRISLMDSAGTMLPEEVAEYVRTVKSSVSIPVGFHGHSSLAMAQANALAAVEAGADEIDGGLVGMACGIGNCCTEIAVATLQRKGYLENIDLYKLLAYIDRELLPRISGYDYHVAITPVDLMLGITGCHPFLKERYKKVAEEKQVPVYALIAETAKIDRKDPSEELMKQVAERIWKVRKACPEEKPEA